MQGFKSFPDRTRLSFERGFTAVVGPNGCGKSNISDAIRWVLGEQSLKNLRGYKMEDVIFVGSKDRKGHSFAKAEIVFDNTDKSARIDCDEIAVGRKLYRDGTSEYLINGKTVALKEILQLFMDTGLSKEGYSMIGQGRIEQIVSAKSQDRRTIFEEAAGITKYKHKKNESLKNLKKAQDNIVRLSDVLGEVKKQVDPLKKQAEKAEVFYGYVNQKKKLELSVWLFNLSEIKRNLKEKTDALFIKDKYYKEQEDDLNEISAGLTAGFNEIQSLNLKIERAREQKAAIEKAAADSVTRTAVLQGEIKHANEDIQRIRSEIQAVLSSKEDTDSKLEEKRLEIKRLEEEKKKADDAKNEIIEKLKASMDESAKAASAKEEYTLNINNLCVLRSNMSAELKIVENKINGFNDETEKLKAQTASYLKEQSELLKQEDILNRKISDIKEQKLALSNTQSGYELKINTRTDKRSKCQRSADDISKRIVKCEQTLNMLKELERNHEGLHKGTASVLNAAYSKQLGGIIGSVSQLIKAAERVSLAIETALGSGIQNIVVKDDQAAKRAIEYLYRSNGGRATFLPISSIKPKSSPDIKKDEEGFLGWGDELIEYNQKFKNIFTNLLARTAVADTLDHAIAIAKNYGYTFKIVTLDGQVINAGGSFTGGSKVKSFGLLTRKNEIDKNTKLLNQLKAEAAKLKEDDDLIKSEIEKLEAKRQGAIGEIAVLKETEIKTTGELTLLNERKKIVENGIKQSRAEAVEAEKRRKNAQNDLKTETEKIENTDSQIKDLQNKLNEVSAVADDYYNKHKEMEKTSVEADKTIVKLNEQLKTAKMFLNDLTAKLSESIGKTDELQNSIGVLKKSILQKEEKLREIEQTGAEKETDKNKLDKEIENLTLAKNNVEQKRELLIKAEKEKLSVKEKYAGDISKLKEQINSLNSSKSDLTQKMWDEYELGPSAAQQYAAVVDDIDETANNLAKIKAKIKGLGQVNLGAVEEYKELKTRYDFLNDQLNDVVSSKKELKGIIDDLDKTMRKLFLDTFKEVNSNFKRIFKELFSGGDACLSLSDSQDVLECGIDISVSPPGKIIKNLSALSGGEKAFVAIAIYFSILTVKPAPFCVLDEIEAALDDVNVDKFASYIKKLDSNTQFIVITHRRGTMLQADTIYGVTMQEEGVSKLLKLEEIPNENKVLIS